MMVAFPAFASWPTGGSPLCTATNQQLTAVAVSDGAGGAIVAWQDNRPGSTSDIYAQRVGPYGAVLWTTDGVPVSTAAGGQFRPAIAPDGAGGAVIAWTDQRSGVDNEDIYVQRVNAAGVVQWTANGVPLCTDTSIQDYPSIASDGGGGAIVAWSDFRGGPASVFVFAQRVNSAGTPQWTANGLEVCTQKAENAHVTSDAAGGAIIAWEDFRIYPYSDVYAQRVNSAGIALWAADGVAVAVADNYQRTISAAPDGSGGVLLAWADSRSNQFVDIYAQRLNTSGAPLWPANGVQLTLSGQADFPAVTSDGAGGLIAVWQSQSGGYFDIFARRVNSAGTAMWTLGGVSVCIATLDQTAPQVVSDNLGGAIFVWQDMRGGSFTDIYAQRYNASGARQWAINGVPVCIASNSQYGPTMVSDGGNGAIMAWEDQRDAGPTGSDIYASRIGSSGLVPTGVGGATPSAAFAVSNARPNPFSEETSVEINLRRESDVEVTIVDVEGRRVRDVTLHDVPAGIREVDLDSHDDHGRRLSAGVYFCEVTVAGATKTQKLVLVK
jgi:hypothetical protein